MIIDITKLPMSREPAIISLLQLRCLALTPQKSLPGSSTPARYDPDKKQTLLAHLAIQPAIPSNG